MRKYFILIVFSTLIIGCGYAQNQNLISPQELYEVINQQKPDQVVLDVRTPEEVAKGKIPGASHLDFYSENFSELLYALDKSKTYYLYCGSGGRSANTSKSMTKMGFEQVFDLEGGITQWKAAGLPLE